MVKTLLAITIVSDTENKIPETLTIFDPKPLEEGLTSESISLLAHLQDSRTVSR